MKLIEEGYMINITKFRKENLIPKERGVIIVGNDISAAPLRVPRLNNKTIFIPANQIAEFKEFYFIPSDQIPEDTSIYSFTKAEDKKEIPKYKWLEIKRSHPYLEKNHENELSK